MTENLCTAENKFSFSSNKSHSFKFLVTTQTGGTTVMYWLFVIPGMFFRSTEKNVQPLFGNNNNQSASAAATKSFIMESEMKCL